jgi:hypothetical protein
LAFSYWIDKPWFLTEGKFATVLIIPSSWGSQLGGHPAHIIPAPTPKRAKKVPSLGQKYAGAKRNTLGTPSLVKKPASRKKATPPFVSAPPLPSANEVIDEMLAPTASYMGLLQDAKVNIGAPPLDSFNFDVEEEEEEEE